MDRIAEASESPDWVALAAGRLPILRSSRANAEENASSLTAAGDSSKFHLNGRVSCSEGTVKLAPVRLATADRER